MISYGKDIAILYHYLTFSVNTRVRSPSVGLGVRHRRLCTIRRSGGGGSQWNKLRDRRRALGPQRGARLLSIGSRLLSMSKQGSDPAVLPAVLPSTLGARLLSLSKQGSDPAISLSSPNPLKPVSPGQESRGILLSYCGEMLFYSSSSFFLDVHGSLFKTNTTTNHFQHSSNQQPCPGNLTERRRTVIVL